MTETLINRVLTFWFGAPDSDEYGKPREAWFKKDDGFDQAIRDGFAEDTVKAAAGEFDQLLDSKEGAVALCILLDQFPRNLYRGSPQSFAAAAEAAAVAGAALDKGYDGDLIPVQRTFLYMPFMHSENLDDQQRCVALFEALGNENNLKFAIAHRDIIARFGRFPHRNGVLGRNSTEEEVAFLETPGSSF